MVKTRAIRYPFMLKLGVINMYIAVMLTTMPLPFVLVCLHWLEKVSLSTFSTKASGLLQFALICSNHHDFVPQ